MTAIAMPAATVSNTAVANVRLTNSMRDRIADKVLRYKYPFNSGVIQEFQKEAASIAQAVYNDIISESDRAKVEALPNGWLEEKEYIYVRFGSRHESLHFNGDLYSHITDYRLCSSTLKPRADSRDVKKRVPHFGSRYFAQYDARHDLSTRFQTFDRKISIFVEEYTKAVGVLKSTLCKCTTTRALVELWPEIKPFVIEVVGTPAASKPSVALTVPISTLNETFGLPVPA